MKDAMNTLFETIARDFAECRARGEYGSPSDYSEFLNNLGIDEGRKYLKVTKKLGSQTMVWGFIMKEDDGKFKKGDILKAASWSAPARNKARGNIFEQYDVRWTGPNYL